jgi:hypothetical protein
MHVSVDSFCQAQHCLVIGVGEYRDPDLGNLPSPAANAKQLAEALRGPSGMALGPEQVGCLVDGDATREAILLALVALVAACSEEDNLVLYFAGHGEEAGGELFVCPVDTKLDDLPGTAISSATLGAVLAPSRCRGVLIVLDCCKSAGFAESAPRFFTTAPRNGHRVLLSASRRNEPSWELPDDSGTLFTKHFIEALDGTAVVGSRKGEVYFSELLDHIQTRMRESPASLPEAREQTPVFVGSYSRDPLIFVRPRLLDGGAKLYTARYSREYLARLARRGAVVFCALALLACGLTYSIADQTEFVIVEDGFLTLYAGLPGLRVGGFPRRKWQTEWAVGDVNDDSPIRSGQALVGDVGKRVLPRLIASLHPRARAEALWMTHDVDGARAALGDALKRTAFDDPELAQVAILGRALADANHVDLLEAIGTTGSHIAGALALAREFDLNPHRALEAAASILENNVEARWRVLSMLEGPCNDGKLAFVEHHLSRESPYPLLQAASDAAIRLRCQEVPDGVLRDAWQAEAKLPLDQRLGAPSPTGDYAAFFRRKDFGEYLLENLRSGLRTAQARVAALLAIAPMDDVGCDPVLVQALQATDSDTRKAAAIAVAAQCANAAKLIQPELLHTAGAGAGSLDANVLRALGDHLRLSANDWLALGRNASSTQDKLSVNLGMSGVPCGDEAKVIPYLWHAAKDDQYVPPGIPGQDRVCALIALDLLDADPRGAEALIGERWDPSRSPQQGIHTVPQEAATWFGRFYPHELFTSLLPRLGESNADFAVHALGRSPIGSPDVDLLREHIGPTTAADLRAEAVYIMHADAREVSRLLRDPLAQVRNTAMQFAAGNASSMVQLEEDAGLPDILASSAARARSLAKWSREALDRIARLPRWELQPTLYRMVFGGSEVSPGLVIAVNEAGRVAYLSERRKRCGQQVR